MDIHRTKSKPYRVGIVLVDGFALMSYASVVEPLRAANLIAGKSLYDVRHIPVSGARSVSSSDAVIGATAFIGEQVDFDLLLVVAGGNACHRDFPRLFSWLRLMANRKITLGGVSAGPLLLARAGVMEGHRMTIHWEHAQQLAALSPNLIIERSLFVRDRGRETCAGGTAALDMLHSTITEHHGGEFARRISDWFMHTDIRLGEQSQQSDLAARHQVRDKVVLNAIKAMENHMADPLTLSQVAGIVGVSVRQVNRLFRQHLDTTTTAYYRGLRLQKAQALLSGSLLSVSDVSIATGFSNPAHFSRVFSAQFGNSPQRYRHQSK